MTSNYQDELLTSRVNIKLNKGMAGDPNKQELPFKVLAIGDYSHGNNIPLDQKEKILIDQANFDLVLDKLSPSAVISVPNELANDGSDLLVRLELEKVFTDKALADKLRTELEQVIYPNS